VKAERAWRRHLAWAAVTGAYLFVFPYFAAINNPNENVRVWTTRALVQHGTFAIDEIEAAWGEVGDRAAREGRRYSSKAPGTALLGVPVHFVHDGLSRLLAGGPPSKRSSTWALRVFTVALPLSLFFLYFARRVEAESDSPWARDLLLVGLALGTMMYPYGLAFVGHAQSAALLFAGFLALVPPGGTAPSPRRLALAGALAALAVVFEYQALLGAAVVGIFAVVSQRRRALFFALGALAPALLLALYHAALFGRPWELPYAHLDDPDFQRYHHARGFLGLGQPRARVLRSAFFDVDYGLFVFSPFLALGLLVALYGLVRRGSRQHAVVLAVTVVMAVFLSGMANWRGGWCAGGPRYIAVVVPFVVWALALTWKEIFAPRWWAAALLGGLVLASVLLCGLSGAVFPHYPLQFNNPVFDLALRLVGEGFAPYGLGTLLGLTGPVAYAPLAMAFALALVAAFWAPRKRAAVVVLAALVAASVLVPLSRYGRRYNSEEERVVDFVRRVWEPREKRHGPD
jgi:hypothetical protein